MFGQYTNLQKVITTFDKYWYCKMHTKVTTYKNDMYIFVKNTAMLNIKSNILFLLYNAM